MVRIGKGKKVHIKCPRCIRIAVLDRATVRHNMLVYECPYCKLKFRVPKNWRGIAYEGG
jgi:predicted RNA-binding Zn-ribbon protein involved in translation (DUF1610 family)